MKVIGLGTQDTFEEAQAFVEGSQITFPMLWDATFGSWRALGVIGQPAAILVDRGGARVRTWFGPFDEGEVLDLAAGG